MFLFYTSNYLYSANLPSIMSSTFITTKGQKNFIWMKWKYLQFKKFSLSQRKSIGAEKILLNQLSLKNQMKRGFNQLFMVSIYLNFRVSPSIYQNVSLNDTKLWRFCATIHTCKISRIKIARVGLPLPVDQQMR